MVLLFFLLLIAGVIIYKLNDKVQDDKVIKSNFSWKEKINSLEKLIKFIESEEDELKKKGLEYSIKENQEDIKKYKNEILKLKEHIYNNELYLRDKGRI